MGFFVLFFSLSFLRLLHRISVSCWHFLCNAVFFGILDVLKDLRVTSCSLLYCSGCLLHFFNLDHLLKSFFMTIRKKETFNPALKTWCNCKVLQLILYSNLFLANS